MTEPTQPHVVHYDIVDSPIGQLLVAALNGSIVQLAFENHDFERVIPQLEATYGEPAQRDPQAMAWATTQLAEYFAGTRTDFDVVVNQRQPDSFVSRVQHRLTTIPYGQTLSYGELAQQLDRPGAARAVGSACAKNPVPLFQPCHRVVRADGSFGEFSGGPGAKAYLLSLEQGEHPNAPTS